MVASTLPAASWRINSAWSGITTQLMSRRGSKPTWPTMLARNPCCALFKASGLSDEFRFGGHLLVLKSIQSAAQRVGAEILPVEAQTAADIEKVFSVMAQKKAGAVIVPPAAFFASQRRHIAELAAMNRLASIGPSREYAEAGGLIAYGTNSTEP